MSTDFNVNLPLVSIVSPCYNGASYLGRFLDSVLAQTYDNIELIIINDGSTDQTEEIIRSYESKFELRGYGFHYMFQENQGPSVAINKGLKVFSGSFLTWPDSDDVLHPDNITKKVNFLQTNQQFDMVVCKSRIIDEQTLTVVGSLERNPTVSDDLFEDLIIERNVYFAPGGYMVRSCAFFVLFPTRSIIEHKAGQNWQILLPFAYYKKCGIIDEFLFDYYLRHGSHSRKLSNHESLLLKVLDYINPVNFEYYRQMIKVKYVRRRLMLFLSHSNYKSAFKELFLLLKLGKLTGYDVKKFVRVWITGIFR